MGFRGYFFLAKLAVLGSALFGIALGLRDAVPENVTGGLLTAAAVCLSPYVVWRLAMWVGKPQLACPFCDARCQWSKSVLNHRLYCAHCGTVVGRPVSDWRLRVEPPELPPQPATRQCWLPDPFCVNFSEDLVPEFRCREEEILGMIREIRMKHDISAKVRLRDDPLMAQRKYAVVVGGHRVRCCSLDGSDDVAAHLAAMLDDVCREYGEAIRFFADQYAAAP